MDEWNYINNKKPKHATYVLAWNGKAIYKCACFIDFIDKEISWVCDGVKIENITHWKNIPKTTKK